MPSTRPINTTEHINFIWRFYAKLHEQFDPLLSHEIRRKNIIKSVVCCSLFEKLKVTWQICNTIPLELKKKKKNFVKEQKKIIQNIPKHSISAVARRGAGGACAPPVFSLKSKNRLV